MTQEKNNSKYSVGDRVRVRNTLLLNNFYKHKNGYGDFFVSGMEKYKGLEATISEVYDIGYQLDICSDFKFTDGMLVTIVDTLAESNAISETYYDTVVLATMKSQLDNISKLIDKAIDEGDREEFEKLSSLFNSIREDFEVLSQSQNQK